MGQVTFEEGALLQGKPISSPRSLQSRINHILKAVGVPEEHAQTCMIVVVIVSLCLTATIIFLKTTPKNLVPGTQIPSEAIIHF